MHRVKHFLRKVGRGKFKTPSISTSPSTSGRTIAQPLWEGRGFVDSGSIVTFLVGPEGKEFKVHKEHICHHSPVLKAAFNSSFAEGQTQTYRLEDVLPGPFTLFVQWIYTGSFKLDEFPDLLDRNFKELPDPDENSLPLQAQHEEIVQLWLLAQRLIIPPLQNYTILELLGSVEKHRTITTSWIPAAYAGTVMDSPLRMLAVLWCFFAIPESWYISRSDHFPPELLADFARNWAILRNHSDDAGESGSVENKTGFLRFVESPSVLFIPDGSSADGEAIVEKIISTFLDAMGIDLA